MEVSNMDKASICKPEMLDSILDNLGLTPDRDNLKFLHREQVQKALLDYLRDSPDVTFGDVTIAASWYCQGYQKAIDIYFPGISSSLRL
jgi:hypothetical protein